MPREISSKTTLEEKKQLRAEDLMATLQCYENALRNSNVTVFTQDRDLRYLSISNPFLGLEIDEIVGRTDQDIIPEANLQSILAIKQDALTSGSPKDSEVQIQDGSLRRWFDVHVEPLRNGGGEVIGLACAAVDITERKESEDHLRLLMRELTHRSKNLLAVVQALARQTAKYTRSTDDFLERFSARLLALSRSHDLLIEGEWHGVALDELVRTQLSSARGLEANQIAISGPELRLRPDAAQRLGLALHELAANAMKYGALSKPSGRLSVTWSRVNPPGGGGVAFTWTESAGGALEIPKRRGLGSLMLQRDLARSLEANVDLRFTVEGVKCLIEIPEKHLFPRGLPAKSPSGRQGT